MWSLPRHGKKDEKGYIQGKKEEKVVKPNGFNLF